MAQFLEDGTVIPSYLSVATRGVSTGGTANMNDFVLRLGEVKQVVWPDSPLSHTKTTVEYTVQVMHRNGNNTPNTTTFSGCTVSNLFGGVADRMSATLRADSNTDKPFGVGSKVLLLCLDGSQQRSMIIGGIKDTASTEVDQNRGHNLFFEFNGLRFVVDKEGQATVTFRGATKVDGTLSDDADANAEGTSIAFTKDGTVTVSTPDQDQYVKINHKDKKIQIQASGNVEIKSTGVQVGDATDAWVKGTTYRNAERTLHNQVASALNTLTSLLTTAAAGLSTAAPAAGPAGAGLGSAAVALSSMAPLLSSLGAYIQSFEGQDNTYLSSKNKTD
jgi:hypothetical protein